MFKCSNAPITYIRSRSVRYLILDSNIIFSRKEINFTHSHLHKEVIFENKIKVNT